ncbi:MULTISPECIES: preprotein translocase subunit SecY [Roseivirga]|uniref:preprotein translocase subunit SecY n=1 Tax=Roseivirga TaxID=290180 RepID=UPI000D799B26|nr:MULTISPECIES: preprotein translocase subunit SecY [Roseivirga]PWL27463.1 MAG: preprotein translocase subunit SecY [Roseivirga sp. XM-24bin3]MBO6494904.1 preprotein translocase subunit SecY [Roseivirga sp.]MBO6661928.1 preprotein translocase subunit SecY [Roseivirga sp.]MBO6909483.1 preprotein translocase subunit SecY [Roseivirga sp.]WPZ08644.1 preprotein translocase subunit SecY [Roseivirga spongicola]
MKKFITTIKNIFSIEELRNRILATLGFLVIFRLGSFVVLPGVDPTMLNDADSGILGILNTLLGGSFSRASIFGLGIMPYISASIVIQLMTVAVPSFQKMQKEGESGRKKLTQITRVLTILVTLAQSVGYLRVTIPSEAISPNIDPTFFMISSMVLLTSGTMFCMWLGEKITDKGIGNGISMLIMIGIISSLPGAAWYEFVTTNGLSRALFSVVEILVLFGVVIVTVALVQAVRRIPVQYAKQVVGGKVYGGQRQFIPLKVNAAGVMPIIFAQALMILPTLIGQIWQEESDLALRVANVFSNPYSWQYTVVFAILIIAFTFFYTAITVNPSSMADDLKRNGGFIPGIKPGRPTSEFIGSVLDKITLPGSIFLAIIAILPTFAYNAGVGQQFSYFYGGTSLLIMVGVILDTLQQIESYLLMRHYEGMMKSGKMRGRSQNMAVA